MTTNIPVITRGSKGSPVTHSEFNGNIEDAVSNLAQKATETKPGVVQLASLAETIFATGGEKVTVNKTFKDSITQKVLDGSAASLGSSGWWEDPITRFTIQWGKVTANGQTAQTVTFPKPFSAIPFGVHLLGFGWKFYKGNTCVVDGTVSTTGFTHRADVIYSGTSPTNPITDYWIAIGRMF